MCTDVGRLRGFRPNTQASLRWAPSRDIGGASKIYVYVDGTVACEGNSVPAWAFAVLSEHGGSVSLQGFANGLVCCDPAHSQFIGASRATRGAAELSALAWGLMWVAHVSADIPENIEVEFVYDSRYAAGIACLENHPRHHRPLARITYGWTLSCHEN